MLSLIYLCGDVPGYPVAYPLAVNISHLIHHLLVPGKIIREPVSIDSQQLIGEILNI